MKYEAFDVSHTNLSGGKTGSIKVSLKGQPKQFYQLKQSIQNKSVTRQAKAFFLDHENFGEVIAADIARALFPEPNLVPEVTVVMHEHQNQAWIASKYLTGVQGTLTDYAKKHNPVIKKNIEHVAFVSEYSGNAAEINLNEISALRQSLANAIALSAVLGDHDIHSENMLVIKNDNVDTIARIDFGHAFNDLLRFGNFLGGGLRYENRIIDFLNRESLASLSGSQSKLWRDYPGMVPSHELALAFKTMVSKKEHIIEGIHKSKQTFLKLYQQANPELKSHIIASLNHIYNNINPHTLTETGEQRISAIFTGIQTFCQENIDQMKEVSDLMETQAIIDDQIKNSIPITYPPHFPQKQKFQWIKTMIDQPPFEGTIQEYAAYRRQQLCQTMQNADLVEIQAEIDQQLLSERPVDISQYQTKFYLTGEVQWLPTTSESPAFKGTIEQYIVYRRQQLAQTNTRNEELLSLNDIDAKELLRNIKQSLSEYRDHLESHYNISKTDLDNPELCKNNLALKKYKAITEMLKSVNNNESMKPQHELKLLNTQLAIHYPLLSKTQTPNEKNFLKKLFLMITEFIHSYSAKQELSEIKKKIDTTIEYRQQSQKSRDEMSPRSPTLGSSKR